MGVLGLFRGNVCYQTTANQCLGGAHPCAFLYLVTQNPEGIEICL
jgi:hypothetical protein